jgi:hypothetical protein
MYGANSHTADMRIALQCGRDNHLQLEPHVPPNHRDIGFSPTYCPGLVTMDPLQTVGLQASWMTTVAHGVPVVPPAPSIAIPSTTNREYVEFTTTSIVDTVLKIAKEASDTFKNVPYIKAFAGIVIQIITIREVRELSGERNGSTLTRPPGNSNGEGAISRTHR